MSTTVLHRPNGYLPWLCIHIYMAAQGRDDRGRFSAKMRDQDVLKAFDYEATDEDPFLTATEIAAALDEHFGIEVTVEAVRNRLEAMRDEELVTKRRFGAGVAYRALVGPRLAEDVAARSDTIRDEFDAGETISHEELRAELDNE